MFCRTVWGQPTPVTASSFLPISLWALSALPLGQIFLTILVTLTLLSHPFSVYHLWRVRNYLVPWHWKEPNSKKYFWILKKIILSSDENYSQSFFIQINTWTSHHFGYCLDERAWGQPQDLKGGERGKAKYSKLLEEFPWHIEELLSPGHWNHAWT